MRRLVLGRRSMLGAGRWSRDGRLILGCTRAYRLVSIPFGGVRGGTHTLLVGATGSGKTVTQTWLAVGAIERGMGAIVIDPKGDRTMREAVADAAHAAGKAFVEWTPEGPSVYNPFARGTDTEIADKVLAGERFTEPHYLRQAQRFLGHVVRGLRASGTETSLRAIVSNLDPSGLEVLARALPEPAARAIHAYLDALTTRQLSDLAGVRDRLSILAESDLGPWLDPASERGRAFDLLETTRAGTVVYFDLDADRRPLLVQMLGAAIVQDLQTTVAELQASPTPTVVVIDEFSALAAEQVVRLFGRARSAGMSLVLSTQELADLRLSGREALLEQVLGNLTVLLAHRQVVPASAELVCGLAGMRGVWRTTQLDRGGASRTRVREGVLGSSELMHLPPGWVAAVTLGDGSAVQVAQVFSSRVRGRR
jgi:type IV secretory pathway TraG/TraD family ATPase VirD4